jgi:hypothetical protein
MRKFIKNGHWSYGPYRIRRQSAGNKSYMAGFARYLNGKYIDWYPGLRDAERACEAELQAHDAASGEGSAGSVLRGEAEAARDRAHVGDTAEHRIANRE